jgi:ABC-type uncharacterized transport system permease subunit
VTEGSGFLFVHKFVIEITKKTKTVLSKCGWICNDNATTNVII